MSNAACRTSSASASGLIRACSTAASTRRVIVASMCSRPANNGSDSHTAALRAADIPRLVATSVTTRRIHSRRIVDTQAVTCLSFGVVDRDAALFRALSDSTRRLILDELVDRHQQTLFEICARLATKHGVSSTRQAISQHLDVLEEAGLVHSARSGRYRFFDLDTGPLCSITDRWPLGEQRHEDLPHQRPGR
jgi:DNA-binding transcriptional ArsR family regulator